MSLFPIIFQTSDVVVINKVDLADAVGADIHEIRPKFPYSKADLNWMDKKSRSTIEMTNKAFRPEIEHSDLKVDAYDVVFLGFPIWWYVAPTIINTFLEKYDFSNKKIILFATSGGSRCYDTTSL